MSLLAELQRRNVFRVGAAYVVSAWLLIQVAETIFPLFGFSDAPARIVVLVLAIGFIPTLVFAWAFELTPEGLKLDKDVDRSESVTPYTGRKLDRLIMVVLALALGYFGFDKFVLSPARQAEELATTAEKAREAGRSEAIVDSYGDKSIAVLPFTDMSPERDQGYFSDGLAEELLNLLAKYEGLRVISRSSSFSLRDSGLSTPELAQRLHVAHVLEGSVRKAGNQLRITAQLIEAGSDTHLWSETYDRELGDVFAIQYQITAQVVQELKVRLLDAAPAATNSTTYDTYLQALSLLAQRRSENHLRHAIELFEQVIEADPNYAPAHGNLALALAWSDLPPPELGTRLEAAANQALELDPGNSEALSALGLMWDNQGQTQEARDALEQAIESNPSNAIAYRWLGRSYGNVDPIRYVALTRKAHRLDPLDPTIHFHLAQGANRFGRTREALAAARLRLQADPADGMSYVLAAHTHHIAGRLDRALKSFYHAYRVQPEQWGYAPMFWVLADLGELELAAVWIRELKRRTGWEYVHPDEAVLADLQGRPEEAVRLHTAAHARGEMPDQQLAWHLMRTTRDFDRARELYEQGFDRMGRDPAQFDPAMAWPWYMDYAQLLLLAGDTDRGAHLIAGIRIALVAQLADGVRYVPTGTHLRILSAALHSIDGSVEAALTDLRQGIDEGHTCADCLRFFPSFDTLREEPEFIALVTELEASNAAQRQALAEDGMLLTPDKVMALEGFDFDSFVE